MSDINWRDPKVADALLMLMSAIEQQDIVATLEVTATIKVPAPPAEYIGEFFGNAKIYERRG